MDAIRVEQMTKRFGPVTALDGLNLTVAEGEIFGLVGPDGAGKTTALRLLASIMEPTSGSAWLAGKHTVNEAEAVKERIGYMSQRFGLYADLTVMENLDFYADIYDISGQERRERIEELLAFSHLAPFKNRRAANLSGGMKQKLGLACALVHTPKILLLDEPTNGVDPVSRRDFWKILYKLLPRKVTIFVSTAYLDEAERCNRVGLLHHGRLIALGTPDEIKSKMPEKILEIRTADSRKTATLLKSLPDATSINVFGDRVHVVTENPESLLAQARTVLSAAQVEFHPPRTVPPALEDVFISLLGQHNQSA
jgi:ABC-2 type transport system ATP-binding protein